MLRGHGSPVRERCRTVSNREPRLLDGVPGRRIGRHARSAGPCHCRDRSRRATVELHCREPRAGGDRSVIGFLPRHDSASGSDFGSGLVSFSIDAAEDGDEECEEIENDAKIRFDVHEDDEEDALNTRFTEVDVRWVDCPLPSAPSNPDPANGTILSLDEPTLVLGWIGDQRPDTRHRVRLERDGVLVAESGELESTTYEVASLVSGDYTWRVTSSNPRGEVPGPSWSFTADVESTSHEFVRGDPNASGTIDLSDPVFILTWLFLGGQTPSCVDAADANGDHGTDIADAIYVLVWLFAGGQVPPAPSPSSTNWALGDCGTSASGIGCESFAPCP